MQQKATVPVIVLSVVVVAALVWFLGKTFMAPSPTNNGKHVFPSFIDPSTGKPWAGRAGGSGMSNAPGTHNPGAATQPSGTPGGQ
jgi:hypothetical protein